MIFYAHSRHGSDTARWQRVEEHLEAVAEITSYLAGRIGMSHAGELAGLVHDLGKYTSPPAWGRGLKRADSCAHRGIPLVAPRVGGVD
jgi:hypothetical protein